ncbi:unnamed protein product, partial [Symbiodinium natans]
RQAEVPVAPLAAGMAIAANPMEAAYALLPPLEDVPLEEIGQTRQGMLDKESDTFMGVSFPVWLFVIGGIFDHAGHGCLHPNSMQQLSCTGCNGFDADFEAVRKTQADCQRK